MGTQISIIHYMYMYELESLPHMLQIHKKAQNYIRSMFSIGIVQ